MSSGVACVLFTDLVGSTELMGQLGDATFDAVRSEHFACLREALSSVGGIEVKTTGDGLLATFVSAVDALAGAVAAQQAADRHARRIEVALSMRVGLALGEVTWEGSDVFGTPVVEAARLVAAARPGQILCSALVRAVAGSRAPATVTDAGEFELKGLPEPVAACEVAWQPEAPGASSVPLPPLLTPAGRIFVGRDGPLERARTLWKEIAGDGGRRLMLLAGEPGIGKTRLAAELAGAVHEDGALVLAGRCDEDLGVPYQPFVEALRHYVTHAERPDLGPYGGELVRLLPDLAQRVPGLPEPLRSDPETERYRLFDAVAAWLAAPSLDTPILLVLDDLHWAAKPTILLLRHVLRAPEPARLLMLVTYRDTDISRADPLTGFLADLRREGGVERVSLGGLDRAGVGAFIEAAAGHSMADEDGQRFAEAMWEETEGNPFFITELVRHLAESGAIEQRDGRWMTTAPIEELGIPEGIRDVIGRRLTRLAEGTERVLAVGAVVGLEFDVAIVTAAGGFAEDEVFAALEEANAARLLTDLPGGTRCRFAHALVRATLYDEISPARRVALHRRVGEAIEAVHGEGLDDHLPALAYHWSRATAPAAEASRAVDYAARAGDRALAQLANDEAAAYYAQALEILDAAGAGSDVGRRPGLLVRLGEAQCRAGDPAHRETLLAAARLAREMGDSETLVRAALANTRGNLPTAVGEVDQDKVSILRSALEAIGPERTRTRAMLLALLALESMFLDAQGAVSLSDEALDIASELGDPETLARVVLARFLPASLPGMVEIRLAETARLMESIDSVGDPALAAGIQLVRGRVTMEAGQMEECHRCLDAAADLAETLRQPGLSWRTRYVTDFARAALAGRLEEAEALAVEVRQTGVATGQPDAEWIFCMQLAGIRVRRGVVGADLVDLLRRTREWSQLSFFDSFTAVAHWHLGQHDEAAALLEAALTPGPPMDPYWVMAMSVAADAAGLLGHAAMAAGLYDDLAPHAGVVIAFPPMPYPCIEHWLGVLAATLGRHDAAAGHFSTAAAIHERIGAPGWLAESRAGWAGSLLRGGGSGDAGEARMLLDQAAGAASTLGLEALQRQIAVLAAEDPA